jgi:hypothetical protein
VGVADLTWHVGASAGQYGTTGVGPGTDPSVESVKKLPSNGVQSRLSARALVLEGADGERVALIKTDNYLAQDLLSRRVAQLLDPTLRLPHDRLIVSATHDHSSPYYATPSAGVWVFQDVWDLRAFEYQARQIAAAVTDAARSLVPARLGATTVSFAGAKGNIAGRGRSADSSPFGYPDTFGDHGVVVLRVDDVSARKPKPLATWMNYGQHPESLDGYDLISADFLAPLQRFVERDTGSTLVFSQGDVGSSEGPYDRDPNPPTIDGVPRAWAHAGYAQAERFARLLADRVVTGWNEIGDGGGTVPFTRNVPVSVFDGWIPGPVSHPYPAANSCDTATTLAGEPGIGTAADCTRPGDTGVTLGSQVRELMAEEGIDVLPDNYDMPAFGAVEENARIHLQAVRLGEILLASCSCEAQVDLILNLESRTDAVAGNVWDGFDWTAEECAEASTVWRCPTGDATPEAIAHMRAQVHNDARGWDDLANAPFANREATDLDAIRGNFTRTEIQSLGAPGYRLAVGLGHTGDYIGYTVSYREYMARDHYRKALTSYGPHTADYVVSRLVRMAAALQGGQPYDPFTDEPLGAVAEADEARQTAVSLAAGQLSSAAFTGWEATVADSVGGGTTSPELQPPARIERFSAADFSWYGGPNYLDNPVVRVERRQGKTGWVPFADGSGEVPVRLTWPASLAGPQAWRWTATFEAFDGFPTSIGQVPDGTYRFVVEGRHKAAGAVLPYRIESTPFEVGPWTGVPVQDLRVDADGSVSASAAPHAYPATYTSASFPLIRNDKGAGNAVCHSCSFRAWASKGSLTRLTVTVVRASGGTERIAARRSGDRWVAPAGLVVGDRAFVAPGDAVDSWGERNGAPSVEVSK